jgi:importin subunit alpha-2
MYCEMVEECNGLDKLESLQNHESEEIYNKTLSILSTFFDGEDETEVELTPATAVGASQYAFGNLNTAAAPAAVGVFNF